MTPGQTSMTPGWSSTTPGWAFTIPEWFSTTSITLYDASVSLHDSRLSIYGSKVSINYASVSLAKPCVIVHDSRVIYTFLIFFSLSSFYHFLSHSPFFTLPPPGTARGGGVGFPNIRESCVVTYEENSWEPALPRRVQLKVTLRRGQQERDAQDLKTKEKRHHLGRGEGQGRVYHSCFFNIRI